MAIDANQLNKLFQGSKKPMKTLVKINHKKEFSLINGISNQLREIVILDPTIPDSQHIASGIKPGTATYILESQPDAVEQITTLLAKHTPLPSCGLPSIA